MGPRSTENGASYIFEDGFEYGDLENHYNPCVDQVERVQQIDPKKSPCL